MSFLPPLQNPGLFPISKQASRKSWIFELGGKRALLLLTGAHHSPLTPAWHCRAGGQLQDSSVLTELCRETGLSHGERCGLQDEVIPQAWVQGISREEEKLTQTWGQQASGWEGREMVDGQDSHFDLICTRNFNCSSGVNTVHFPPAFTLI